MPILPEYQAKNEDGAAREAVTYLYVGYKHRRAHNEVVGERYFRSDYGADAEFTVPLDGKRGWYDSGVRLGPLNEDNGFVQVEISRWERFDYGGDVALAWALPHTNSVEYRDLGLSLGLGASHRLGIYVRDGIVYIVVDSRRMCSTRASVFVAPSEPKYFQVRSETSVVGSNGNAAVSGIRMKRDVDSAPRAYRSDCVLHRYGIFWHYLGMGRYRTDGAFDPAKPTFFTGTDPAKPCRP